MKGEARRAEDDEHLRAATDIVERLRGKGNDMDISWNTWALCAQAADEIERGRKELDIAWAAGLFEGEGAICCAQKYKTAINKNGERRKSGFRWWLVMHSTDHDVLRKFHTVVSRGKVYGPYRDKRSDGYKPQLRWATTTLEDAQAVLRLFYPYLGDRRREKAFQCLEAVYVREPTNRAA